MLKLRPGMIKKLHAEFLQEKRANKTFAEEGIAGREDTGTHVASASGKGASKSTGLFAKSASVAWRPRAAPDTQLTESDFGP